MAVRNLKDIKRIAVLTSGGDCAGMNACIRSIVRTAVSKGLEVIGFLRGYIGLVNNEFIKLNHRSVSGIINLGGTILKTGRCKEFYNKEAREMAIKNLKKNQIDGLIVIGGNGSFKGANLLFKEFGINIIGVPATIDNDIWGTDLSIGADTAVNVALDAIDKIRDTATSLERIFVIEVMGRDCGYIALQTALAGGCEDVLIPEKDFDIVKMCEEITEGAIRGKISWIIIVAEGKAKASEIANKITQITGLETRVCVLGHIQRGGRPTATDRILASRLGAKSVELLLEGKTNLAVGIKNNKLTTVSLEEAIKPKPLEVDSYYKLIKILT